MRLMVLLLALPRGEAEGYCDRKAASRHESRGIGAVDWGGTVGEEDIGDSRARNRLRGWRSGQGEALHVVGVEQVGCAQPDLGSVEDRAIADGVVDVGIDGAEGGNDGLIVIGPVVDSLFADAVIEDAQVLSEPVVGEALLLGVRGSAGYPKAGGRVFSGG